MTEKRMCFIKDTWRPLEPGVHAEWEVYIRLKEAGVDKFIATAICGADVVGSDGKPQYTLTQDYREGAVKRLRRVHCRLVTREIGKPLIKYEHSGFLMSVTYHALRGTSKRPSLHDTKLKTYTGHQRAWELAKVLHRDVSIGNIMIDAESPEDNPQGFLNDWDLCKYKEDLDTEVPSLGPGCPSVSVNNLNIL